MHFKRKCTDDSDARRDYAGSQLRFAEKPAGIDIASQPTRGYSAKIVHAPGIRAVIKARRSGPTRDWKASRRRTVTRNLIFLDRRANQGAGRCACGCANRRATNVTSGRTTDDCASRSAPAGALTNWGFARTDNEGTKRNDESNCKNLLFHIF